MSDEGAAREAAKALLALLNFRNLPYENALRVTEAHLLRFAEGSAVAGVRDGEDWTAFTETPCEDDIAHDRHVWRGLFPDPRLCPGVPSDFEVAVADRLAEVAICSHLFAGRTCTRCKWTMPAAASESASRCPE